MRLAIEIVTAGRAGEARGQAGISSRLSRPSCLLKSSQQLDLSCVIEIVRRDASNGECRGIAATDPPREGVWRQRGHGRAQCPMLVHEQPHRRLERRAVNVEPVTAPVRKAGKRLRPAAAQPAADLVLPVRGVQRELQNIVTSWRRAPCRLRGRDPGDRAAQRRPVPRPLVERFIDRSISERSSARGMRPPVGC